MAITRQHASTDVAELVGVRCEKLFAIPGVAPDIVIAAYLLADGTWYRFFIDAGLLFLDECEGPDPEDDLAPGDDYVDIGANMRC